MKSEQEIKKVIKKLEKLMDKESSFSCGKAIYGTYISVLKWVIGEKDTVISDTLELIE